MPISREEGSMEEGGEDGGRGKQREGKEGRKGRKDQGKALQRASGQGWGLQGGPPLNPPFTQSPPLLLQPSAVI